MPIAFDTHLLITRLIQGQMPQGQAEAVSAALTEALDETIGTLATKKDLEALESRVANEFKHLKWMIGVNLALTLLILGKLLLAVA